MIAVLALAISSCAHVISQEARNKARYDVPFSEVAGDPFFYEGSLFVWGGVIVQTTLTNDGSVIEVRQAPLDRYGAPKDTDVSYGRFLVRSSRHLDPLIFEEGREVTVAGVLVGGEWHKIGEADYEFPVLDAREIHLWKETVYYPAYYYDPWYYDRWYYGPWDYDPWYRHPHRYRRW